MHRFTIIPLALPIFQFPEEKKRVLTLQDLIFILRYCRLLATGETSPPREQSRAQYCADALNQIASNPERKRAIFCKWPRSPTCVVLTPDNTLPGMDIPDGLQLWGETMFDFYQTSRHPSMPHLVTITTGSKMMAFAKANNEVEVAKEEVEWAETENKPKRLLPYTKKSLEMQEEYLRLGLSGKSSRNQDQQNVEKHDSSATDDIFHESNLPAPWPFVPFSYQPEPLQTRIPLHKLPKTITVHDRWDLLSPIESDEESDEWERKKKKGNRSSRPDRTFAYRLKLNTAGREKVAAELAALNASNPIQEKTPEGYYLDPLDVEGPRPPAVWIVPPPRPPRETQAQARDSTAHAHLYLSPSYKLGTGHHSVLYEAEWDVPRPLLLDDDTPDLVHCQECGRADARNYLKETDGENGEKMEAKWKTPSAYNRKVISETPRYTMEIVNPFRNTSMNVVTHPGSSETRYEYEGEVRTVHTSVGWQDPRSPTCPHLKPIPLPLPVARVRVAAKLSLPHDPHLPWEANNYQKFPQRMFEHWNGLSIVRPCQDPVPNGPIVPQFYGYYVPEDKEKMIPDETRDGRYTKYLSPILLLELCGRPIDVDDLTQDEKNEASSLYYRFHYHDWTHGSIFTRNILCQYGPLHLPYSQRHTERSKKQLSFRLIDFGRSLGEKDRGWGDIKPITEGNDVGELFDHFPYNVIRPGCRRRC